MEIAARGDPFFKNTVYYEENIFDLFKKRKAQLEIPIKTWNN